ncbi:hypothetical protein F9U64_01160 [Gracilibacillus oryzae]|uniref:Dit-like phage tail protein N-terminal domain-containing protein n=1 Tax=Gracilibacillus oryzae TaxID=1672701 RepID=A0A7C8L113_9BACI|nr:DNA circularization N-terminal domain-containing protein [Gracilibacillus oryzae]KAB8139262.1 hypothetical protein F9U64_01160 [Gracilibacillus oryzae]
MARLGNVSFFILSESHNYKNTITEHPVEDGNDIADHVGSTPTTFNISGMCTGQDAPSKYAQLLELFRKKEPVTYVGRGRINTVVIESFPSDRDADIANGFNFSLTLKQVRIVKTSTVDLLAPEVRAQVKDVGNAGRVQAS